MIGYDELIGYFNFTDSETTLDLREGNFAYPCLVCHCLVLSIHTEEHVHWHKEKSKPDREKTPNEIQAEARRELGRIRSGPMS